MTLSLTLPDWPWWLWTLGALAVVCVVGSVWAGIGLIRELIGRQRPSSQGYEPIDWEADWNLQVPDWFDDPRYDMSREELWGDIYDLRESLRWEQERYALRIEQMAEMVAENSALRKEVARLSRLKKRYWRRIQRLTDPHKWLNEIEVYRGPSATR